MNTLRNILGFITYYGKMIFGFMFMLTFFFTTVNRNAIVGTFLILWIVFAILDFFTEKK